MKKKILHIFIVLLIFACGFIAGTLVKGPGKAEAGYGCMYYTASSCYNSGAPGDELYVEIKFSKAMNYSRYAYSIDKKKYMVYFLPQ